MQLQDALHFLNWMGMIIHTQINETIIEAAISAFFTHDKQCCRLLSPAITTRCLPRCKGGHQSITKMSARLLKCAGHRRDRVLAHQNITLAGVMFPYMATSPGKTFITCKSCRFALHSHDSYLAAGTTLI